MAILWYLITVFNKIRYYFTANMMVLSEIDFQKCENTYDISWLPYFLKHGTETAIDLPLVIFQANLSRSIKTAKFRSIKTAN